MDEVVTRAKTLCLAGWLALSETPALAQGLIDPMRPPAAFDRSAGQQVASTEPVLQSVLVGPNRRVAVIDGETVRQGDRFRDARVARIIPGAVELVRGAERQVLKLNPVPDAVVATPAAAAVVTGLVR